MPIIYISLDTIRKPLCVIKKTAFYFHALLLNANNVSAVCTFWSMMLYGSLPWNREKSPKQ